MKDPFQRECDKENSNVSPYEWDDGLDGSGKDGYGGEFD